MVTAVRPTTNQVRRSWRSWSRPRKTCSCRAGNWFDCGIALAPGRSEIFGEGLERLDRLARFRRGGLGMVEEMMLDMVEDQQRLDLLQRLLDRLELLHHIGDRPARLDHP